MKIVCRNSRVFGTFETLKIVDKFSENFLCIHKTNIN
jgi:hypothetical protein